MNPASTRKETFFCLMVWWGMIAFIHPLSAQLTIDWDRTFGGAGWEELNGMALTPDFGYLFCGTTFSNQSFDVTEPNRGVGDFWVVKTDSAGTLLWQHRYGGDGWDRLWAAIATSDGGFLLGGESDSNAGTGEKSENSKGGLDYWIVKIDENGLYQWDKTIGGAGQDTLFGIVETDDGYVLGGFSGSYPEAGSDKTAPNYGNADFWVVKLSKNDRTILWDKTFGGNDRDQLFSMKGTPDGGLILGGSSRSAPGTGTKTAGFYGLNDMWLVRLDAAGNQLWDRSYGGDGEETIQDILQTSDGGFLLTGQSSSTPGSGPDKQSPNFGHWDYYVVKTDADGNVEWERTFGGEGTDLGYGALENGIGNFLVSGVSASLPNTGGGNKTAPLIGNTANDFWMIYLSPAGDLIWDMSFGGNNIDSPPELHVAHNGGYVFGGHSSSNASPTKSENSKGLNDFYVIKTKCPVFLNIEDIVNTCQDEPITLNVQIEECPNCVYYWNDGYEGPTRTLPNDILEAEYEVTAVHEDGCSVSDGFKVLLAPSPQQILVDMAPITCFNESDGMISVLGAAGGTPPYRFIMDDTNFVAPTDFYALPPGDYYLTVVDTNECTTDTLIHFEQPQEPLVSLPGDLTLEWGDSVQIQALVNPVVTDFEWRQTEVLSCLDCLEPYAFPLQTTTLGITVRDANGCEKTDQMTIRVVKNLAVYIPNAFSPNGDGLNDYISVYGNRTVRRVKSFLVFDRWGQLMFENHDFPPNVEPAGWNGRFEGKDRKPGVYVYWAEVEFIDGTTELLKGDVILTR